MPTGVNGVSSDSSALRRRKRSGIVRKSGAALQSEIGGGDGAAGHPGNVMDAVEQRHASSRRGMIEALEHAVGERRGARSAAGERQADQNIVAVGGDSAGAVRCRRFRGRQRKVDRRVVNRRATAEGRGAQHKAGNLQGLRHRSPDSCPAHARIMSLIMMTLRRRPRIARGIEEGCPGNRSVCRCPAKGTA